MAEKAVLFCFGAVFYGMIEVIWRGFTHWTMLIAGGICFLLFGVLNRTLGDGTGIVLRCLAGGAVITTVEFVFGVVFNLWLGMGVWDYSRAPLNLLGQVCLPYFALWSLLSAFALYAERYVRFAMFGDVRYRRKGE